MIKWDKRHRRVLSPRIVKWETSQITGEPAALHRVVTCLASPIWRASDNASAVIETSSMRLLSLPKVDFFFFPQQFWNFGVASSFLQDFHQARVSAFRIQYKLKDPFSFFFWGGRGGIEEGCSKSLINYQWILYYDFLKKDKWRSLPRKNVRGLQLHAPLRYSHIQRISVLARV